MVYFIREEKTNFVKIGYTRHSIRERMVALQIGNPRKLHLLNVFEDDHCDEQECHQLYSGYHIHGEWFELPDNIIQKLESGEPFAHQRTLDSLVDETGTIKQREKLRRLLNLIKDK